MNMFLSIASLVLLASLLSDVEGRATYSSVLEDQSNNNSSGQELGCEGGAILLSRNKTLAPPELVQASDSIRRRPPGNVYNSVSTWCTHENDPDPFIDLQFTSPILVTMMATTGTNWARDTDMIESYYITNFTLEYSTLVNSSLMTFYSGATDLDNKKYFEATEFNTLIQFERPFLTQRIRLKPVEWYDSFKSNVEFLCLGVAIYGCLGEQVVELSSMNTTATQTVDNKSMAIVLAVTLLTIATLLVLLIGLVCFVVQTVVKGKRTERGAMVGLPDGAYSHLNRSQQSSVSSFSQQQSGDINGNKYTPPTNTERSDHLQKRESVVKKVDNPLYGSESTQRTGRLEEAYSNIEIQYEMVAGAERVSLSDVSRGKEEVVDSTRYEPVGIELTVDPVLLVGTPDSMVDNELYSAENFGEPHIIQ